MKNENSKTKFCEIKVKPKHENCEIIIKRFQYKGNAKHIEISDSKGYVCTKKATQENDMFILEDELSITSPYAIFRFIINNDLKIDMFKLDADIINAKIPMISFDTPKRSANDFDYITMINNMENRIYERIMNEVNILISGINSRLEKIEAKVFSADKSS